MNLKDSNTQNTGNKKYRKKNEKIKIKPDHRLVNTTVINRSDFLNEMIEKIN